MSSVDSAGGETVRIVAGLGNPGSRYRDSRHNLGFRVIDELARRRSVALDREECKSLVGVSGDIVLAKPLTYMNRSGYALRCLHERTGVDPESMLVIYDEVRLPLGRLRLRPHGEPAGHRGMESIVSNLRTTQVPRLRLGVGPAEGDLPGSVLTDYVLERFESEEEPIAEEMIHRAADAAEAWLEEGIASAMNQFNRPPVTSP